MATVFKVRDPLRQRPLRLASGTALCLAASFGLDLPIPVVAPVFAVFLLATLNQPLSLKAGLGLALVVMLTTGCGLLLVPLLRYYAFPGVLLIGLCLFLAFRYGLRGGNNLVATFLVAGLTMISAAGTADYELAVTVVGAIVKGLLLAVLALAISHWMFPEPARDRAQAAPQVDAGCRGEAACVTRRAGGDAGVRTRSDRSRQLHADHHEVCQSRQTKLHDDPLAARLANSSGPRCSAACSPSCSGLRSSSSWICGCSSVDAAVWPAAGAQAVFHQATAVSSRLLADTASSR